MSESMVQMGEVSFIDKKVADIKAANTDADIFMTSIGDEVFIYKAMNKKTYSDFRKRTENTTDPEEIENVILEMCVLYPEQDKLQSLIERRGGLASNLADEVYKSSGFAVLVKPVKL